MSTLVVETGAGLSTANSLYTVAEGDAFAEDHFYSSAWTSLGADDKRKLAIMGSRVVAEEVTWDGSAATSTQALPWPRYDTRDRQGNMIASNTVPNEVKLAAWLTSLALADEDRTEDPLYGFSELQAGPIKAKVDKHHEAPVLPRAAAQAIAHLGRVNGQASSVFKVART